MLTAYISLFDSHFFFHQFVCEMQTAHAHNARSRVYICTQSRSSCFFAPQITIIRPIERKVISPAIFLAMAVLSAGKQGQIFSLLVKASIFRHYFYTGLSFGVFASQKNAVDDVPCLSSDNESASLNSSE